MLKMGVLVLKIIILNEYHSLLIKNIVLFNIKSNSNPNDEFLVHIYL